MQNLSKPFSKDKFSKKNIIEKIHIKNYIRNKKKLK